MRQPHRRIGATLAAAIILLLAGSHGASAKEPTAKVLADSDKVRVTEVTYLPGNQSKSMIRGSYRVVRALRSGTLQRIFSDGKTETWAMTAGDVKIYEPDKVPYATRNIGTADLLFYVVALKKSKK